MLGVIAWLDPTGAWPGLRTIVVVHMAGGDDAFLSRVLTC